MIQSMTGYGTHTFENETISITAEVKSLNSKQTDINLRLPRLLSSQELNIRNTVSKTLGRGKMSVLIEYTVKNSEEQKAIINKILATNYYNELKALAEQVNDEGKDIFRQALLMPNVIENSQKEALSKAEIVLILDTVKQATAKCQNFRQDEGRVLSEKLSSYIQTIEDLLQDVIKYDPERVEGVRKRINEHLEKYLEKENIDNNRFEQELIYYIEKLDVTEEKVRLKTHLDYFKKILSQTDSNGKKLGFIGQEIGREINTIGSKANNATLQQIVVNMKDELEKIKEQVLNVL